MTIRAYETRDKEKCLAIFSSNCPQFFDQSEFQLFSKWLDHQADQDSPYQNPAYQDAEKDVYLVIESPGAGIVGCGGFYIVKDSREARLAWGMIDARFHKQGFGTALYIHRKKMVEQNWPAHVLTLGTSQHTFPFYEKMGMRVTAHVKAGYGPDLDRYDMTL
jgi:[ribosomal protein S18]-alanine N-acetyltransferase